MSIAVTRRWVQGTASRGVTRPAVERRIAGKAMRAEMDVIRAIERERALRALRSPGPAAEESA